jgi:hypothetical protein
VSARASGAPESGAGRTAAPGATERIGPAELRRTLARLREAARALRARPFGSRLDALGGALEEWRDSGSRPRRALAEGLPAAAGFTRPVVERGLALALEGWTAGALARAFAAELGAPAELDAAVSHRVVSAFPATAVLLAGAIPSAELPTLLAALALGSAVLAKPPARDPLTAALLADSLARVDPALAAAFSALAFDARDERALAAFCEADCVVATGSDATVARVAARVAPPRRLVAYGHRVSFAAIGPGALASSTRLADAAGRLALDVALWDQLGCLSPVALLVAGGTSAARRAAEALAAALARIEGELPRGEVAPGAAAAIAHERAEAEMRSAARGRAALLAGAAWTVVAEEDADLLRSAPLHRFVRVHPVEDASGVCRALAAVAAHLAAVGVAGFDAERPALASALAALGASRVCPIGTMQAPPLAWCHDGQGLFLPLARLSDVEGRT